jgi:hypothetical protein
MKQQQQAQATLYQAPLAYHQQPRHSEGKPKPAIQSQKPARYRTHCTSTRHHY